MRIIFLFLSIISVTFAFSQELKELRHTKTTAYKCDFYISFSEKKMKYEDTLHYFWFKAQKIHNTQGSSEGHLLNGSFTKFYHSGQMAEYGQFERGLKDGQWKSWYESGNLKTIYHYSNGQLSGNYTLYNESGDIRESGKIKRGEKNLDEEKIRKPKKEKKRDWSGTHKPSEEKIKAQEEKKEERAQNKREREYRREKEGNFIQRLFNKEKTEKPPKDTKPKKDKKDKKPKDKEEKDS